MYMDGISCQGSKVARFQEGELGMGLQLGDGGILWLGGHVVVKDSFLLRGAAVVVIWVL
jgi:hypothetical protein